MRGLRWIALAVAAACAGLVLLAAILRQPADPSLAPAAGDALVIHVFDHGYHASMALPAKLVLDRARALGLQATPLALENFERFDWVEIGWGDENFYRNVPSASLSTMPHVLRALLLPGNASVLHIVGIVGDPRLVFTGSDGQRLAISHEGMDRMIRAMERSFRVDLQGAPTMLGPGLYGPSAFFAANGRYHLFHVCNHWLANRLADAGLPLAPVEATLSGGLMYDLRRRSVAKLP